MGKHSKPHANSDAKNNLTQIMVPIDESRVWNNHHVHQCQYVKYEIEAIWMKDIEIALPSQVSWRTVEQV